MAERVGVGVEMGWIKVDGGGKIGMRKNYGSVTAPLPPQPVGPQGSGFFSSGSQLCLSSWTWVSPSSSSVKIQGPEWLLDGPKVREHKGTKSQPPGSGFLSGTSQTVAQPWNSAQEHKGCSVP